MPAPATEPARAFRPDIQGLRALAVLLVALGHAGVPGLAGGYVGVDVFFVISGFLITGTLLADARHGVVRFGRFYARRARRILPAATLVLVTTCVVGVPLLDRVRAQQVLDDALAASVFVANVRFGHGGIDYFDTALPSPLQHYWSLAVEEQFYVVWPALVGLALVVPAGVARLVGRRGRVDRVLGLAVTVFVIFVVSLTLSVVQTDGIATGPYFSAVLRAWELAAGALLALFGHLVERVDTAGRRLLTWTGAALILYAATHFDADTAFPGSAALVPVLGAVALIAGGAGDPAYGANRLLGVRPLRGIGELSYSFYLWHWPVLILAAAWAGHPLGPRVDVALLGAALVLAAVTYRFVENPVRTAHWAFGSRIVPALAIWPTAVATVLAVTLLLRPAALPHQPAAELVAASPPSVAPTPSAGATAAARPPTADELARQAVAASLAVADRGAPVPGDLAPAPERIARDYPSLGECSGWKRTSNKICTLGDTAASRTVVLIGNSHAGQWVPTVDAVAKRAHWRLAPFIKEGCNFPIFRDPGQECGEWYRWALGQIAARHPGVVVLGGETYGSTWESTMKQVVADLRRIAPRVVYLRLTPGLEKEPTSCLFSRGATLEDCVFTQPVGAASAEEEPAARAAGAAYVDTRPWFCAGDRCPTVVGSTVAYSDDEHVSATYARRLVPAMAEKLAPWLTPGGAAPR